MADNTFGAGLDVAREDQERLLRAFGFDESIMLQGRIEG